MAIDIITLVFEQILRIDPSVMFKYATTQDQLLYLLFIPHIVLLMFIAAFSKSVVSRMLGAHTGFKYLVSIAIYIFFILSGWYGRLTGILVNWLLVSLLIAFVIFMMSILWHPSATGMGLKLAGEVGGLIGKATVGKSKAIKTLKKELEIVDASIERHERAHVTTPEARAYNEMQIQMLEEKKAVLEKKIEQAGG